MDDVASVAARSARGGLFQDLDFDYEARLALGAAACGTGDVGLVLATLDRIADGDPQSWFDAWMGTAGYLETLGEQASQAGHADSARWALLGASEYYDKAMVFVDGMADQSVLPPTFRAHRYCWEKVVDASGGSWVRLPVPYEGDSMPGYLLRPDASGTRRPTLVVINGSDGSLPGLMGYGAAEALARGWNAFLFDGPGQQSMLFDRGVPFRYDWEAVVTPVIDTLVTRPEVGVDALVGYGISQGGYWITRALAFEHRMKAAVADPGVVDLSETWTASMPPELLMLLREGRKEEFNAAVQAGTDVKTARTLAFRSRPYQADNLYDVLIEVSRYQVRDVVDRVRTPLLITDPEEEQFFPGQPRALYDMLPGEKSILGFSRDQGADFHCQPTGRRLTHTAMLDFLADHLPTGADPR
ncbi:dipeptidyl aminopeptidase [Streptomyces sp. ICBB 8177]|uniref:alpha/beta hydrolase family protein n=1 Tax=Streptomyces sp. ICBB 8177 TaxID=563922 RepID=UPI000D674AB6|nr:dipeptidyl aminopeptidase [Streptomyces sp. ICBB 8177]PWI45062.1 dipeptidyl aminopeptidase [Streptomyces sp. ICBB 8177]